MLVYLLLLMACSLTPACSAPFPGVIPGNDASMTYLSMIFGMDGGSHIVGHLSHLFSTVMLGVAGVLWTYTAVIGILNTASEGQFLGQKWSSLWVPVRTVIGMCLLIPKGTTGYSLIQVLVMSIVIKGVGVANLAWQTSCDYLKNGGVIVESIRLFPSDKALSDTSGTAEALVRERDIKTDYIEKAGSVLKSEVCMMLCSQLHHSTQNSQGYLPRDFSRSLNYGGYPSRSGNHAAPRIIRFPEEWKPGICGSICWNNPEKLYPLPGGYASSPIFGNSNQMAIEFMVKRLLGPARKMASTILGQSVARDKSAAGYEIKQAFQQMQYELVRIAETWYQNIQAEEAYRLASTGKEAVIDWEELKRGGWLMAGLYYSHIAKVNQVNQATRHNVSGQHGAVRLESPNLDAIKQLLPTTAQKSDLEVFLNEIDVFIEQEKANLVDYHRSPWLGKDNYSSTPNYLNDWLLKPFEKTNELLQSHMHSVLNNKQDTISALSTLGIALLESVENFWNNIHYDKVDLQQLIDGKTKQILKAAVLMPMLIIWMTLNFAMGSIFVYYIPLVPFLLFFFGSLSWFLLVITAIVSAPLMALGIMHPEGHDFFGQAEQGVRLLFGLFLRPILMIFGFILAMVLCRVIFQFFNYGYGVVTENIAPFDRLLSGVSQIATVAIYMSASLMIINRCFGLIYELPNKALSWIGWQTDGHNESEVLHQVKGSMDQYVNSAARDAISNTSSHQSEGQSADVTLRGRR